MSLMEKAVASASRRYKDVPVVLNGLLAAEFEELQRQVMVAGMAPQREGLPGIAAAQAKVTEWVEAHRDQVLHVRVYSCIGAEWPKIRAANPISKEDAKNDPAAARYGFDVTGAAVDAIEAYAVLVDPAGGEEQKPAPEDWEGFWPVVGTADLTMLTNAVVELNGTPSEKKFGDLVKA